MKTELKAKFLQHMIQKKQNKGFTLIELLVVIIIIGILSAIALPSFLNQAAKAKQSEAKTYIGSVNRAQQAYRIEKSLFATDIVSLEIGIPTLTEDYKYTPVGTAGTSATITAIPKTDVTSLKSFIGKVEVITGGQTAAGACQTKQPSGTAPAAPQLTTGSAVCAGTDEPMR